MELQLNKVKSNIPTQDLKVWLGENVPKCYSFTADESTIIFYSDSDFTQEEIDVITAQINSLANTHKIVNDVTPRQIRQALVLSGVSMEQIDNAINSLSEPTKTLARIEWEYSNSFQRDRLLVAQVGYILGWNSAQLDALWTLAGSL